MTNDYVEKLHDILTHLNIKHKKKDIKPWEYRDYDSSGYGAEFINDKIKFSLDYYGLEITTFNNKIQSSPKIHLIRETIQKVYDEQKKKLDDIKFIKNLIK